VSHTIRLLQRGDWHRSVTFLKKIPIRKQLVLAKLCPGFDQPLLPLRNRSGDERHRRDGKHSDMLLIIRMKMCGVMAL
jgi:hypothetical protein